MPSKPLRVLLVGNYPPPAGGISVHIERLRELLLRQGHAVEVLDLYGRTANANDPPGVFRYGGRAPLNLWRAIRHWRKNPPDVVHFHVTYLRAFELAGGILLGSLPRGARRIITIHGGGFVRFMAGLSRWRRKRLGRMLQTFDRVIAVNDEARQTLNDLGIAEARLAVIPAFLPAPVEPSAEVDRLLSGASGRIALACGSGFDYYGFDAFLDAVAQMSGPKLQPVLAIYGRRDEAYMARLTRRIAEGQAAAVVLNDLAPGEFAYLLRKSDIFVRPTDRDGDSVAVREAVQLGKQVIASDCAPRPPGVILFKTNDTASLARALQQALDDPTAGVAAGDASEYAAQLLQVYQTLI